MAVDADNLIWIDLEMTGLDPDRDHVIEIATIVTDKQLNILAEGPMLAIHQPDSVLDAMDDWNRTHHGDSGLTERVRASTLDAAAAEAQTLAFLVEYVPAGASPMAGNSICQDRRFMAREMPLLEAFFHYRNLALGAGGAGGSGQAGSPPRARRHPRLHRRAGALPRAFPAVA